MTAGIEASSLARPMWTNLTAAEIEVLENINAARTIIYFTSSTLLLFFGVPGNVMTICVLASREFKDNMFSMYLTSLCFFNTLTLVWCVPRYICAVILGREIYFQDPLFCVFYRIICVTSMIAANGHLMLVGIVRLAYLFDSKRRCALLYDDPEMVIVLYLVLVFTSHIPLVFVWISFYDKYGEPVECYLSTTSPMLYVIVMFETMFLGGFLIIVQVILVIAHKKEKFSAVDDLQTFKLRKHLLDLGAISSVQYIISLLPLCLMIPNLKRIFNVQTPLGREQEELGRGIIILIAYTNVSSNFIVYFFFGRKFRHVSLRLLRRWKILPRRFGKRKKTLSNEPTLDDFQTIKKESTMCGESERQDSVLQESLHSTVKGVDDLYPDGSPVDPSKYIVHYKSVL